MRCGLPAHPGMVCPAAGGVHKAGVGTVGWARPPVMGEVVVDYRNAGDVEPPPFPLAWRLGWPIGRQQMVSAQQTARVLPGQQGQRVRVELPGGSMLRTGLGGSWARAVWRSGGLRGQAASAGVMVMTPPGLDFPQFPASVRPPCPGATRARSRSSRLGRSPAVHFCRTLFAVSSRLSQLAGRRPLLVAPLFFRPPEPGEQEADLGLHQPAGPGPRPRQPGRAPASMSARPSPGRPPLLFFATHGGHQTRGRPRGGAARRSRRVLIFFQAVAPSPSATVTSPSPP